MFKGTVNSLILDYEVPPEYDAQQVKPKREDTNEKYGYQNYEDDDEGTIYSNQSKTCWSVKATKWKYQKLL